MHSRPMHWKPQGYRARRVDKTPPVPRSGPNKYLRTFHRFDHGFRRPGRVPVRPIGRRPEHFGDKLWWRKMMGWSVSL